MKRIANILTLTLIISFSITTNGECLRPASTFYTSTGIEDLNKAILNGSFSNLLEFIRQSEKQTKVEAIESFIAQSSDQASVKAVLLLVFMSKSYKTEGIFSGLDYYQRIEFISKCLSLALLRRDSKDMYDFLKNILKRGRIGFLLEAKKFISSYITVYGIKKPMKIATTFALFRGQKKIQPFLDDNPIGQDFLRKKIRQLTDLYSINPHVMWQLIAIQDGDDSGYSDDGRKTVDVAKDIAEESFPELVESERLVFLGLMQDTKEQIGSVKGGANIYGMRWAVDKGADYVIYTDGDLSTHLGQEGLLLEGVINGDKDIVISSINKADSLVPYGRRLSRRILSAGYLWVTKIILPELLYITDTQRSFKCYSKEALRIILPVDRKGNFDKHFVYNFSFDGNLLTRAIKAGFSIGQEGIVWIDFPAGSTVKLSSIFGMLGGLIKQRLFLTFHDRNYKIRAKHYHTYRDAKAKRQDEKKVPMKGSTKAKDLYFKDITAADKIRLILANYDLGANSIDDVEFEELPGVPSRPPLLLKTPKGKFVIKYGAQDIKGVRFIVSAILYLRQKGFPVVPLIKSKKESDIEIDNYWFKVRDDYFLIVKEYMEGDIHSRIGAKADELAELGAFIAKFHSIIAGFKPMGRKEEKRVIDVVDYQKDIESQNSEIVGYWMSLFKEELLHAIDNRTYSKQKAYDELFIGEKLLWTYHGLIIQEMEDIKRNLTISDYEGLPKSVITGDINFNNLIYNPKSNSIKAFFDWDKARIQPRVEDLKNPIMALPQGEGRTYDMESVIAIVLGYQLASENRLTDAELAAIPEIIGGTFLWTSCSYFLLNMEELSKDDSFYRIAEKDLAIFRRFKSEKVFLKAILSDIDSIMNEYNITGVDEITDELVAKIIRRRRQMMLGRTSTIPAAGLIEKEVKIDRSIKQAA